MPSVFRPNPGFARDLEDEARYKQGLASAAKPAAAAAKALAPVGEVMHTTKAGYTNRPGDYRDSIKILTDAYVPGIGHAVSGVVLTATDWKAWWIEYGTVDTPIFAPLRRGVRAAGLKLKESDRK